MAAASLKTDFTMNNLVEFPEMLKTIVERYIPRYKEILCYGFHSFQIYLLEGVTNPTFFCFILFFGVC